MRDRTAPFLFLVMLLTLAAAAGAALAAPAGATPSKSTACTSCHRGAASGTVTATPSNPTPAPGATYSVDVNIGLTATGQTGYRFAQTDATGTSTTWMAITGGPASQTLWTRSMTAPAAAGTYYYKVWTAKGPDNSSGMGMAATYSITVAAPVPTPAITTLTPAHAQAGASVVILGTGFGSSGAVKFGATAAATTAWSATSITATVPASLGPGATSVTVTPAGAAASSSVTFTVDAPPAPVDTTDPVTVASGVPDPAWRNTPVTVSLAASDEAGGSGVKSVTYMVDGGTPVVVPGAAASVQLASSGSHTLAFFATDEAGNSEATQSVTVNIDTAKPQPRALRAAKVRQMRTVKLRYKIVDAEPNGGTAAVKIVVKNSRGKIVARLKLGDRPVNTALAATFACKLRPGTYRFHVSATDAAGNPQTAVASQKLRVLAR
jgi:hypothetical protein